MHKTIALLTDFGIEDIYVGVMKGVMRKITPDAEFVDISHAIHPQSVREGAFALLNSYRYFPEGTVFLVVIDPGVGSTRKPIAVQAGDYAFIAPDNGVLSYTLAEHDQFQIVQIENTQFGLASVSNTFHGRDIFAPAAAHLAAGIDLERLGPRVDKVFQFPHPHLRIDDTQIYAEVIHIDHFGNLITSMGHLRWIDDERLMFEKRFGEWHDPVRIIADNVSITVHGETLNIIRHAYHESQRGELLAQVDSNGYLEIAVNQGSAAKRLDASIGDHVMLKLK